MKIFIVILITFCLVLAACEPSITGEAKNRGSSFEDTKEVFVGKSNTGYDDCQNQSSSQSRSGKNTGANCPPRCPDGERYCDRLSKCVPVDKPCCDESTEQFCESIGLCIPNNDCCPNGCGAETCFGETCIDNCGDEQQGTLQPDCPDGAMCGDAPNGCGTCGTCRNQDPQCATVSCVDFECKPETTGDCSFYARCDEGTCGPQCLCIGDDGFPV